MVLGVGAAARRPTRQVARDALPRRRRAQWRAGASREWTGRGPAGRGQLVAALAAARGGRCPAAATPPPWSQGPLLGAGLAGPRARPGGRRLIASPPPRAGDGILTPEIATLLPLVLLLARRVSAGSRAPHGVAMPTPERTEGGSATLRGRFTLDTA